MVVGLLVAHYLVPSSGNEVADATAKVRQNQIALPTIAPGKADGTWTTTGLDGRTTLVIASGTAELKTPHDCPGTFGSGLLDLACADGNKDRQTGMAAVSEDGTSLTVVWDSGRTDSFTKG